MTGVLEAHAIMMTDDGRALCLRSPVGARRVATGCRVHAGRIGAGEDVVHIDGVAAAADGLALFAERGLLVEVVGIRMQILDGLGDGVALWR